MYLFKSHCYSDLTTVHSAIQSELSINGFGIIQSVDGSTPAIITFTQPDQTTSTISYTIPECQKEGFINSYSGLTTDDANEISFLIIAALAAVWAVKILRRGL
jgi:hypothetical protein